MSEIVIANSTVGSSLQQLLMCDDLTPGDAPSYQVCKEIYLYHPLGGKMVDKPIKMAMSKPREISIPNSPEKMVKEAFEREWEALKADFHIRNVMRQARIYGVASIIYGAKGVPTDRPIAPKDLPGLELYFNVLDPLNTAGSLVLNQDPNAPDFQKHGMITASGQAYHRSRSVVVMNEDPIYIAYTSSAFGYVGRSVFQRVLYPMKSFVQSMITDDLVTLKAGVLIAKTKNPGSIVDRAMQVMMGVKRQFIKEAVTGNVISIEEDEAIESLDLHNADTAMTTARKNILENIAAGAHMPAKLLNSETYAEGFGEGSEDAKEVVRYLEGLRDDMAPVYEFFDRIVKPRAWNPEFYKTVQAQFPDYKKIGYQQAFYQWSNAFTATWANLLEEPESERVKVEDTKFKAVIALLETMIPQLDPENRATLLSWAADNFNEAQILFPHPLLLDYDALREYVPPAPTQEPAEPRPFSSQA